MKTTFVIHKIQFLFTSIKQFKTVEEMFEKDLVTVGYYFIVGVTTCYGWDGKHSKEMDSI